VNLHKRDSIEAHLTVVSAGLAVSCRIEEATAWSIRNFVRTARRYRTIEIQAGTHTITATEPLPDDLRQALEATRRTSRRAHQPEPTRGQSHPRPLDPRNRRMKRLSVRA
jgi:hypothetical protein